jgi:hypothetical protein
MTKKGKIGNIIVLDDLGSAYLAGTKAAITVSKSSRNFMADPENLPQSFTIDKTTYKGEVQWGENNTLPQSVIEKIYKNPVLGSGLKFTIDAMYGDGIKYGILEDDGKGGKKFTERNDIADITMFFEENDINGYHLEMCSDMATFYNTFPEIIFNRKGKIVTLSCKEAAFSRWEEMDEKAAIKHHFYSARWGSSKMDRNKDIDVTDVLDSRWPLRDLMIRLGRTENEDGELVNTLTSKGPFRFIIPISYPTPGRSYYQKPYWFSIFESGWYDFACKIPEFKNALMDNQMEIKYHIELSDDYFPSIFRSEGITEPEKHKARIIQEYTNLNKFLSDHKNSGKSVISYIKYSPDGNEMHRMTINVIEQKSLDGKYIEDSEEASNVMSYGMGVHPSLIGSSPGKAKTINGTEARELWIIKQAQLKPMRDRLLMPLNLIKAVNEWPKEIVFAIPNMMLTTLDKGTGSEKTIS